VKGNVPNTSRDNCDKYPLVQVLTEPILADSALGLIGYLYSPRGVGAGSLRCRPPTALID